ncbi:MAG: modulated sigma54 specific transcriptional regulator, Fis family [Firmicutes bacterium]|nr:modulated sigma54 specific transcriptional regulator, Fis family [Bacillota bacterium]
MNLDEHNDSDKAQDVFSSIQTTEQWYIQVLDSINNGILVADQNMLVRYINAEYTRITGVIYEQIVGKILTDVRPGAMLPQVVEDGKPLVGVYRKEGDIEYVVDMAPIVVKGGIIGAVSVVKDITEVRRLSQEIQKVTKKTDHLKTMVDHMYKAKYIFADIIGNSEAIAETIRVAKLVARGEADVLLSGESGTGKEVFAQAIHNSSSRASGPFVAVNCATIAPTLIESELFGYEEGAFTGAKKGGRPGLFETASGGTIFLDEIAELSLETQAKLLRVLQERAVRRVGETNEIPIDVRVISATNRDLDSMVRANSFRQDLYYRLNVLSIFLPPLRERGSDIAVMGQVFLRSHERILGRSFRLDSDTKLALLQHEWPGNVRELKNVIEYAINMCEDGYITPQHLPKWLKSDNRQQKPSTSLAKLVQEFERKTIFEMIDKYGATTTAKRQIAEELNISVATLYNKIKEP